MCVFNYGVVNLYCVYCSSPEINVSHAVSVELCFHSVFICFPGFLERLTSQSGDTLAEYEQTLREHIITVAHMITCQVFSLLQSWNIYSTTVQVQSYLFTLHFYTTLYFCSTRL